MTAERIPELIPLETEQDRVRREPEPLVLPIPFDEDAFRRGIDNDRYNEFFGLIGQHADFRRIIERSRNPQVEDSKAWEECKQVVVEIVGLSLGESEVTEALFKAERQKFVANLKDTKRLRGEETDKNYRAGRRKALANIEDDG